MSAVRSNTTHHDASVFPDDAAWYRRFEQYVTSETDHLCIGIARSPDGADEVLMPMQMTHRTRSFSVLESLDNYYSTDFRPICSTVTAHRLIGPILEQAIRIKKPDLLNFRALDASAPEIREILRTLKVLGWQTYDAVQQVNWIHELTGDYEHYLATRTGRLRNTLKRKTANLMALPGVNFTVHQGNEDLERALEAYSEIYAKSWKISEPYLEFVPQLMRSAAQAGQLRLGILRLATTPVAAHFWIVKRRTAFIYKLAHDKDYDRFSPGTVLLAQMIRHTMKYDGIQRLDFLSGDDTYKRDWMSERREKIQIWAYNPRSVIAQMVRCRDEHIKPYVKQFKLSRIAVNSELVNPVMLPLHNTV